MKGKRILSIVLAVAMILSTMGTVAFAELLDENYPTTGGTVTVTGDEVTYNSLTEAAASTALGKDGVKEYTITGSVEYVTGTDLANGASKVVIKNGGNGEMTLTTNYHKGITANGAELAIVGITINDRSDISNAESALTAWEWAYITFDGATHIELTDVTFTEGVQLWGDESATISNCTFDVDISAIYSLWVGTSGKVIVDGCEFTGTRGIKTKGDYDTSNIKVDIDVNGCTFDGLTEKPALVHSNDNGGTIALENNTYTNMGTGIYASEAPGTISGTDTALVKASVTEDGETTYFLTKEDAQAAADGDSSKVTEYVAKIGDVYYESLRDAMVAAKANQTVELVSDVDLKENEWEPVSFKGKFDGNDYTISNLNINKPAVSNTGFITSLNGAFENVTFKNVSVIGGENTGVVAGRAGGGAALAKNITINGTIKVETTHEGYARLGGIVGGWAYGRYINITVDGGNAETSYLKHSGGGDGRYVAGIVGHADDVSEYTNCVVKNITIDGGWLCGGIAGPGPASSTASGCVVENIKMDADYSGGMFGWFYTPSAGAGVIEDCTIKDVEFTDGASNNGAIGGYSMDSDVIVSDVTIENVVNYGGAPLISYKAAIDENLYADLGSALSAAVEGDTIDLLGNVVTFTGAIPQQKSLTIKNGTINADNPETFNVFSSKTLTFENIELNLSNFTRSWLYPCGNTTISFVDSVVNVSDGGNFISSDQGGDKVVIKNTVINAKNIERLLVNVDVDMDNSSVTVNGTGDNALRNVYGTITDTDISISGAGDNGLKNSKDKLLTIDGTSKVVITGSKSNDLWLLESADVTVGENASLEVLTSKIEGESAVSGDNFVSKADTVYVQYKKTDLDTAGKDNLEGSDTYEIVLAGADAEKINELASADLTFDFVGTPFDNANMSYTVTAANGVTLTQIGDRYMFNYNGVDKYEESGTAIVIGTITVDGYGRYTLGTKDADTNAVYATEIRDSIVDGFETAADLVINSDMLENDGMVGNIVETEIKVPVRDLTIDIEFNNAVNDNAAVYQDMTVTVSGGDLTADKVIKLGTAPVLENTKAAVTYANGYEIVLADELTLNTTYVVTVTGAGYRTARATVTMTEDKAVTFWNNVKDVEGANYLAGDIVKDNTINLYDLSAVVSYFGTNNTVTAKSDYAKYDLNRDGKIDSKDVAYVLVSWGK